MTAEEQFHDAVSRLKLGPRLARERGAGTSAGNFYAQIASQAQLLITSARQFNPRLPKIHFDFIYNGTVNAVAFKDDGQYFIGVNSGTVVLLQLILHRMLADPRLLTHVGESKSEASDLSLLADFTPDAQHMYDRGTLSFAVPKTTARRRYSDYLHQQATLFAIGHEIAHIALGHVDYLATKSGVPLLLEIDSTGAENVERHVLEVDADVRSLLSILESAHSTVTQNQQLQSWLAAPAGVNEVLFDCVFSSGTLFRLFGDAAFAGQDLTTGLYPPLAFRRAMLAILAHIYGCEIWGTKSKDAVSQAIRNGLLNTESAFAIITGKSISTSALQDAFGPEGRKHMELLSRELPALRSRLMPHAYESESLPLGLMQLDSTGNDLKHN